MKPRLPAPSLPAPALPMVEAPPAPIIIPDPPAPEPEAPVLAKIENDRILILEPVHFATDKSIIRPESEPLLQQVTAIIQDNPQLTLIRIEGHTDSKGSARYNQRLSQARAASVRAYLLERGVAAERLQAEGFGLTRPVDTNETDEGRARNRRVDFIIIERKPLSAE